MAGKLLIRDLTLRDGQQSLFATRMKQQQVFKVLPFYKEAGFYAMEVWGGAVPDSVMRYLNEDPWERLETIKKEIGNSSLLTALSRGRNLFGYNPYPEDVIEGFNRNAIKSGIDIMRIFDALNDVENIKSSIKYVKENGGIADCTVCFTVDPKFSNKEKVKAILHLNKLPKHIFSTDYFVGKALQLEKMGADMITIKDMAGLITPMQSGMFIRRLKEEIKVPIDFHTHCTPGYGLGSVLMAIINGVDIVDTSIMNFAGGPAAPAFEIIQIFADKLKIDTGVNLNAVAKINNELKKIRKELTSDLKVTYSELREFDISSDKLPNNINKLFDQAIEQAYRLSDSKIGKLKDNKIEEKLLQTTYKIEKYFNFPEPDENVKKAEIPGGMYTNMLAQLKQFKLEDLLPKVLELVPVVRIDAGCPPLVTPTSQIVGVQAVNCVIDMNNGVPVYTNKSVQFVNLVKGLYGKTPIPISPEFRKKICGVSKEVPYDTKNYKKQENPVFYEYGNMKLAQNEKEELLLELFPSVARDFLLKRLKDRHKTELKRIEEERKKKLQKEKEEYDKLTPKQKEARMLDALNNYLWTYEGD